MGFISNQWLNRGQGLRNRSYNPVEVSVSCYEATDAWSKENAVTTEVKVHSSNGEYQTLDLSQSEADDAARALVATMSAVTKERLLQDLLRELSHAKLLRALAFDLRKRVRLPKDR